jgi:hypothetical protein
VNGSPLGFLFTDKLELVDVHILEGVNDVSAVEVATDGAGYLALWRRGTFGSGAAVTVRTINHDGTPAGQAVVAGDATFGEAHVAWNGGGYMVAWSHQGPGFFAPAEIGGAVVTGTAVTPFATPLVALPNGLTQFDLAPGAVVSVRAPSPGGITVVELNLFGASRRRVSGIAFR